MKTLLVMFSALLLGGCSATLVSVQADGKTTNCPPVVSVHSFGNSVTVSDGSECKVTTK